MKSAFYRIRIILAALSLLIVNAFFVGHAFAGTLTATSVIELGGASNVNPMIAGDGQSLALEFTTAGSVSSGSYNITLTFTGWTGGAAGSINATQTIVNTTACTTLTGASAVLPGTTPTASGNAGTGVITIALTGSDALSATTSYCTELSSTTAVTNPTAAGSYNVTVNDSVDSQTLGIDVLTAGANAYSVTVTVNPTFTMSESGTTDTMGALSSTADTESTGITWTINTNAKSGWFVWAADSNAGLHSTTASKTIASVATGSNFAFGSNHGAENYGLGVSADNTTNYAYTTSNHGGGLTTLATGYQEIATAAAPASNVTFVTHELANISSTTPPATDYTDTITLIGAGSF